MAADAELLDSERNKERFREIQASLSIGSIGMSLPLYLVFWIADLAFAPDLKWQFLALRLSIVPNVFVTYILSKKAKTLFSIQIAFLYLVAANSIPISIMIYLLGGADSIYYAGLNLVCMGAIGFVFWQRSFLPFVIIATFAPYLLVLSLTYKNQTDLNTVLVNIFFMASVTVISLVMRAYHEGLRYRELESRLALAEEIQSRDKKIEQKAKETIELQSLSKQFSPQVVQSILDGVVKIDSGVVRSEVCAMFIDVVRSTERIVRLDKDAVQRSLNRFLDTCMSIILKYDITIDKFLGDGILCFAGYPIKYKDAHERVVNAAIEIMETIRESSSEYEDDWLADFQIRIGISKGFADVGFYGNKKAYRTFTAIGPVINLASRLTAMAEPNQILISNEVVRQLSVDQYNMEFLGKKVLKGFEADQIKVYCLKSRARNSRTVEQGVKDCSVCRTPMIVDTNDQGVYVFRCRKCAGNKTSSGSEAA